MKRMRRKCHICLEMFRVKQLHKPMHSLSHHQQIEELWGRPHLHKCGACKAFIQGLSEYKNHIAAELHANRLHLMPRQVNRFKPEFRDAERDAKYAERNKQRMKRRIARAKLRKKRKAENKKQKSENTLRLLGNKTCSLVQPGVSPDHPGTNYNSGSTHHPKEHAKPHSGGQSCWRNYMFFKNDPDPELGSWQLQKWPSDVDVSGPHLVKMQDVSVGPSATPGSTAPSKGPEHYAASSIKDSGPAQMIYNRVTHLSVELRNNNSLHHPLPEMLTNSGQVCRSRKVTMDTHAQLQIPASSKSAQKFSTASLPEQKSVRKSGPDKPRGMTRLKKPSTSLSTEQNVSPKKQDPPQTKHVLSALLSRSVSKVEPNKPNLKVARSIHAAQRASRVSESRVQKQALQKLLSSKSSEWKVNWEDLYQETTHRKLQQEKGAPRFGIDFVSQIPPESQDPMLKDFQDTVVLGEGFQWDSIESDLPSTFESRRGGTPSTDPCSPAVQTVHTEDLKTYIRHCRDGTSDLHSVSAGAQENSRTIAEAHVLEQQNSSAPAGAETERADGHPTNKSEFKPLIWIKDEREEHVVVEKFSGEKTGKGQLNKLLDVSLFEDKVSTSLQGVDGQLLQAQTALQTAFMEVQLLQMKKHQIETELESVRNKRIQILQRLRNSRPDAASLVHTGVPYTSDTDDRKSQWITTSAGFL